MDPLVREKDPLVREKDPLVREKDRLVREMDLLGAVPGQDANCAFSSEKGPRHQLPEEAWGGLLLL